jgi:hypothetical protein
MPGAAAAPDAAALPAVPAVHEQADGCDQVEGLSSGKPVRSLRRAES